MQKRTILAIFVVVAALAVVPRSSATGTGAVDHVSGWYPLGSNLVVTATPHVYSQFDGWSGDTNGAIVAASTITLPVDGSRMVTAMFRAGVTASNAVPFSWLGDLNSSWTNDFEAAAADDPDGDGFTTAQEYWSGTDPLESDSFLHIAQARLVGGDVRLNWQHARVDPSIPNISIQMRTNLTSGAWVFEDSFAPVEGTNTWQHAAASQAFYRLCVTNSP